MLSPQTKLLAWTPERARDLAAWIERGQELGLDLRGYDGKTSASAAVGEALKRATACRCEEAEPGRWIVKVPVEMPTPPEANPLRALREAAGLSQAQAAARLGMTRGAWANAEKAARATRRWSSGRVRGWPKIPLDAIVLNVQLVRHARSSLPSAPPYLSPLARSAPSRRLPPPAPHPPR